MERMFTSLSTFVVIALGLMIAGATTLGAVRRQSARRRQDQRFCELIRTGVLSGEASPVEPKQGLSLETCETGGRG